MYSKDGNTKDIKTTRICDVVWHNGEFINWNDARVHVMSHVLHYGSSIFEGIECYSASRDQPSFACATHGVSSTRQKFIAWTTHGRSKICATPRWNWCDAAAWVSATSGPSCFAASTKSIRLRRQSVSESAGVLHRRVGLGQVSRRRSDRARR